MQNKQQSRVAILLGFLLLLSASKPALGDSNERGAPLMVSESWRSKIFGANDEHLNEESLESSRISEKEANELFQIFSADSSMNFQAPFDGCYARATQMARSAESRGIIMGKVFSVGRLQTLIRYLNKNRLIRWSWHVAPVVKVIDSSGGEVMMVFDPSLFDKPVTVSMWNEKMLLPAPPELVEFEEDLRSPNIELTFFTRRFQQKPGLSKSLNWSEEDLQETLSTLQFWRQLDQPVLSPEAPFRPEL